MINTIMRVGFPGLLLLLALLAPGVADAAMRALIWQPQLRDQAVEPGQWQSIWRDARADGFDTLVLQWTVHGDAFADDEAREWLQSRMQQAHDAGLALVVGLYSDPAFFRNQEQGEPALSAYLQTLAQHDAALAKAWRKRLRTPVAGWYLPMEIDDRRWRETVPRKALMKYLRMEAAALGGSGVPVYVSTFAGGFSTPANYARLLADASASGVRVWWQDGAGTGKLKASERELYRAALTRCDAPAIAGIVHETFRQTGSDDAFTAEPMQARQMQDALAARAPCSGDSVVFELRYLPLANGAADRLRSSASDASRGSP